MIKVNQMQNQKGSVRVAASSNIALVASPATIDGVALATGDKVLLTGQTDKTENGIYYFDGADLARPVHDKNLRTGAENTLGALVAVKEGSAFQKTVWFLSGTNGSDDGYENASAVIDTDEMEFSKIGSAFKTIESGSADLVGNVDESNKTFTPATEFRSGTYLQVFVNGVLQDQGAYSGGVTGGDWARNGDAIEFDVAPQTGAFIQVQVVY